MQTLRKPAARLLVLGLVLLLGAASFLLPLARAGDDDTAAGWTVEQSGQAETFLWKDRWRGYPNPAGFTLTNEGNQQSIYYYGTFKVTERRR